MSEVRGLLIRRNAAPTDDIYVSSPVIRLVNGERTILDVLDFGGGMNFGAGLRPFLEHRTHVVVSRYCPGAWVDLLLDHPARTFRLYYLVDDDIPAAWATRTLPLSYRLRMARVAQVEFSEFLRGADRVLVTSHFLAEKYAADNIDLLEPVNIWPPASLSHFTGNDRIVVTYHATAIHQGDLAFVAPALCRLHDVRHGVHLEIVTDGRVPRALGKLSRCTVRGDMAWPAYKRLVASSHSHIGLSPLMDTPYNRGKSHVKLFDISALGAVGVYSNRPPYTDVIEDGVNGILVDDDVDAWTAALIDLVDDLGRAKRIAEAAQARAADIGQLTRLEKYWRKEFGLGDPAVTR